jgi:Na+(H+)/acetate symporter ActP
MDPTPKEIIIAILSGAVSLAALLLVFVGLLMAQAASFTSDTPDKIINRYAMAGKLGSIPVFLCLILAILATYWLGFPNGGLFVVCFFGDSSYSWWLALCTQASRFSTIFR